MFLDKSNTSCYNFLGSCNYITCNPSSVLISLFIVDIIIEVVKKLTKNYLLLLIRQHLSKMHLNVRAKLNQVIFRLIFNRIGICRSYFPFHNGALYHN